MKSLIVLLLVFVTCSAFADIRDEGINVDKITINKDITIPADAEFVKISKACLIEVPKPKTEMVLKAGSELKVSQVVNLAVAGSTIVMIKDSRAVIGIRCDDWSDSLNDLKDKLGDAGKLVMHPQKTTVQVK